MSKRFDILKEDLNRIEKETWCQAEQELTPEEELLNAFLLQHASLVELAPLSDDDVEEIWNNSVPERLPISLNSRVKKIIRKHAKRQREPGFMPESFALAFRKEDNTPKEDQVQALEAIKKSRERHKAQS